MNPSDYQLLLEAAPNPYLILSPNCDFIILAVNDAYLKATLTVREEIVGKSLFEVFPDNPEDLQATGAGNLRKSLEHVLESRRPHSMPIQKYDIRVPESEGGGFKERHWSPINTPVISQDGEFKFIIHRVEDVTEFVQMRQQAIAGSQQAMELIQQTEKMQAEIFMREKEIAQKNVDLLSSSARYELLTSILPVGVFHTDRMGNCLYANPCFLEMTKLEFNTIQNQHWYAQVAPEDRGRVAMEWDNYKKSDKFKSEFKILLPDGEEKWVLVEIAPQFNSNKEVSGYVGSFIDITTNKLEEEAERNRAEMLAEIDRAKTVFFSNISHELRTPLTLILGPLEEALNSQIFDLSQQQREWLSLIYRNALRLLKLVNALLDFSRIEANRMQAVYEPTDLSVLTQDLASVFRSTIEKAQLKFIVNTPYLDELVYVDREMYEKIIFNLLSNAIKFTLHGTIMISLEKKEGVVELRVQDTGVGIPASELPHVFERFYRVEGSKGRSFEGSGIGLALTNELVKLHGGSIQVESKEGKGSTFTVTFLLGKAHLPEERIGHKNIQQSGKIGAAFTEEASQWLEDNSQSLILDVPLPSSSLLDSSQVVDLLTSESVDPSLSSKAYVLVVDDNADMRKYIENILSPFWQIRAVESAEVALVSLELIIPDLILCDVMMPGIGGLQLVRQLRAQPETKLIPVILLSARSGEEDRIEGLEAGADDYMVKPFSAKELRTRIQTHLFLGQLRRRLNQEVIQKTKELMQRAEEAEKNKKKLAAYIDTICHGIRNPLTGIKGNNEFLAMDIKEFKVALDQKFISLPFQEKELIKNYINNITDYSAAIEECVSHAKRVVDDILTLSRLDTGRTKLVIAPCRLNNTLLAMATMFKGEIQKKGLKLIINAPKKDWLISTDVSRLEQILANLLSNAIKFTEKGEIILDVRVCELDSAKIELQFSVKDTGMGIEKSELPKLFNHFTQANKPVAHKYSGSGFGLSICEKIVDLMGGEIRVESNVGQGSIFFFTIPCKALTPREIRELENKERECIEINIPPPFKPRNILIVEDNRLNQKVIEKILESKGHSCQIAENGDEAVKMYQECKFDVIFMDIEMPIMNGIEATKAIRQIEQSPPYYPTAIVGLTGNALEKSKHEALSAGMDDYLTKPYKREDIYAAIDKWSEYYSKSQSVDQASAAGLSERGLFSSQFPQEKRERNSFRAPDYRATMDSNSRSSDTAIKPPGL